MSDKIKAELCVSDFYTMLGEAMKQCGGGEVDTWKKQTITEFANVFAQNGIRIVYMPDRHMDAVKVVWEDPRSNNVPYTPPNQPRSADRKIKDLLPKKKQLLCDQKDTGDETWNPAF